MRLYFDQSFEITDKYIIFRGRSWVALSFEMYFIKMCDICEKCNDKIKKLSIDFDCDKCLKKSHENGVKFPGDEYNIKYNGDYSLKTCTTYIVSYYKGKIHRNDDKPALIQFHEHGWELSWYKHGECTKNVKFYRQCYCFSFCPQRVKHESNMKCYRCLSFFDDVFEIDKVKYFNGKHFDFEHKMRNFS